MDAELCGCAVLGGGYAKMSKRIMSTDFNAVLGLRNEFFENLQRHVSVKRLDNKMTARIPKNDFRSNDRRSSRRSPMKAQPGKSLAGIFDVTRCKMRASEMSIHLFAQRGLLRQSVAMTTMFLA